MKEKDDLVADMKRIAEIAHAAGLCGIDELDALCAIRRLTVEHFDFGRTFERMKEDVREAIKESGIYFYSADNIERLK